MEGLLKCSNIPLKAAAGSCLKVSLLARWLRMTMISFGFKEIHSGLSWVDSAGNVSGPPRAW